MAYVWGVLNTLASFLSRSTPAEYTENDYKKILFTENVEEHPNDEIVEDKKQEAVCQHRIGKITKLCSDYGLIDNKYYFELTDLNQEVVEVNQMVRYVAYRCNANTEWKIKQVKIVQPDEWEGSSSGDQESRVTSENLVIEKSIISQIASRSGRKLIMEPGDIHCNLDHISAEFLPIEGDWVELSAIVELIESENNRLTERIIEIKHLKAQKSRIYSGKISHLTNDNNEGIINSEIYFRTNVCEPGYIPSTDDMVVANVIESHQGVLIWRAIFVIPVTSINMNSSLLDNIEGERLFDSKHGVNVTPVCDKKSLKINEKTTFNINIENAGNETQILLKADLKNSTLNNVMKVMSDLKNPISISPSERATLTVEATANLLGFFSDILLLTFKGGWQIGSMLDFYVEMDEELQNAKNEKPKLKNIRNEKRNAALKKLIPTKTGFTFVPGVRPIKPASFIPIQLNHFTVPNAVRALITGPDCTSRKFTEIEAEIEKSYSFMMQELNETFYLKKFHMLLYLEDLELSLAIKKYDKERACFERRAEYLVLEIPNLAESRPSLVVGDKLIATVPTAFNKDGIQYEGYIHKVTADSIRLKFNESFHQSYDGKDYSVTFYHTRTGIRRLHQALNLVEQRLGKTWLFPDTLGNLKPKQVNVVGEVPPLELQIEPKHVCQLPNTNSQTKQNKFGSETKALNILDAIKLIEEDEPLNDVYSSEMSKKEPQSETQPHSYASLDQSPTKEIQWDGKSSKRGKEFNHENTRGNSIGTRDMILKWVNKDLNHYQKEAVRNILKGEARPLPYVIYGPPGTGKTITVVETILQIMYLIPESRILIATPSNSSADLICERLLGWNLLKPGDLVRLVGYNYMLEGRIPANLKPYVTCVDMKTSTNDEVSFDDDGVKYSSREVIGRNRISVGTCVSVGVLYTMGFPKGHFTHVIVDEAGQASEPEIMVPLAFMNEECQAVLAGDPRQLGPVVLSKIADSLGLGVSLLSRFLMRFPYHRDPESYPHTDGYDPRLVTRLLYNYRSLPEILFLYNTLFYESKLIGQVCDKCSEEKKILDSVKEYLRDNAWDVISSVIFVGVRGINKQEEDSPSWYNEHEICQVSKFVVCLYNAGLKSADIGIVTPYQKQVMKIREQLRGSYLDVPKVGTVEEFQGQERKVIILSTVRSDDGFLEKDQRFSLGFVNSKQRLNVAISRARMMLIIIGNPHLLAKDISWRNLLKICVEKNCYFGTDLPNSLSR